MGVNTKRFDSASDMITFSRASGGYGFTKVSYGPELVSNGTFDTGTEGWASIRDGALSWSQGTLKVETTSTNYGTAQASISTEIGKTYVASVDIRETSPTAWFIVSSSNSSSWVPELVRVANSTSVLGSHQAYFTATTTTTYLNLLAGANTGSYTRYDNVSVKEVTYNSSDPSSALELIYHPDNVPRIEYNVDGTAKGLLVEEARANISSNSLSFPANAGCSDAPSTETAPDGSTNATLVTASGNGLHRVRAGSNTTFTHTGVAYAISTFVKNVDADYVQILNGGDANYFANFDLVNGTVGTTGSATTATITEYSNGWFRIAALFDGTGHLSHNGTYIYISPNASAGYAPHANNPGSQMHLWGFQTEAGTFPTSYIETTGATATRALDEAFISVDAFGFNSNLSGTLSVEGTFIGDPYNQVYGFLATLGSAINDTRFLVRAGLNDITDRVNFVATDATGTTVALSFLVDLSQNAKNTVNKITASFGNGQYFGAANGLTGSTTYTGELWTPSQIEIGRHGFSYTTTCHIKSITYYPRRLTDAQLQELTT